MSDSQRARDLLDKAFSLLSSQEHTNELYDESTRRHMVEMAERITRTLKRPDEHLADLAYTVRFLQGDPGFY